MVKNFRLTLRSNRGPSDCEPSTQPQDQSSNSLIIKLFDNKILLVGRKNILFQTFSLTAKLVLFNIKKGKRLGRRMVRVSD